VDGIAGTLAAEIGDEQIDVRGLLLILIALILIDAQKEVSGSEDIEDFLVDGDVSAGPSA
jgi:hypothetical protein